MLDPSLCINIEHHVTGESIEGCLEGTTLSELKKLKVVFLELPISFVSTDCQLHQEETIVLCKCIVHNFEQYQQPLLDYPQGVIVVTPLVIPVAENLGPIKNVHNNQLEGDLR